MLGEIVVIVGPSIHHAPQVFVNRRVDAPGMCRTDEQSLSPADRNPHSVANEDQPAYTPCGARCPELPKSAPSQIDGVDDALYLGAVGARACDDGP